MSIAKSRNPSKRLWVKRRLTFIAVVVLASLAIVFPAQASAASEQGVARHCVVKLAPLEAGETSSRILASGCFMTFAKAIAFASNGRIRVGPGATPAQISPESLDASNVVGIDFSDWHFSGASFTATGGTAGCTGGHNYAINSMPAGWNNIVSSNYPSSGCNRARHWDGTNHTGALIDCHDNLDCYYIGDAMNDRTSSEEWFDV